MISVFCHIGDGFPIKVWKRGFVGEVCYIQLFLLIADVTYALSCICLDRSSILANVVPCHGRFQLSDLGGFGYGLGLGLSVLFTIIVSIALRLTLNCRCGAFDDVDRFTLLKSVCVCIK